jgi:hypothetical protein
MTRFVRRYAIPMEGAEGAPTDGLDGVHADDVVPGGERGTFYLIGSLPWRRREAGDIDLVSPWNFDEPSYYEVAEHLRPYEALARAAQKSIDLFLDHRPLDLGLGAYFDLELGEWALFHRFTGQEYLDLPWPPPAYTFDEIVALAHQPAPAEVEGLSGREAP